MQTVWSIETKSIRTAINISKPSIDGGLKFSKSVELEKMCQVTLKTRLINMKMIVIVYSSQLQFIKKTEYYYYKGGICSNSLSKKKKKIVAIHNPSGKSICMYYKLIPIH